MENLHITKENAKLVIDAIRISSAYEKSIICYLTLYLRELPYHERVTELPYDELYNLANELANEFMENNEYDMDTLSLCECIERYYYSNEVAIKILKYIGATEFEIRKVGQYTRMCRTRWCENDL